MSVRIAVHVHAFYPELLNELADCVGHLSGKCNKLDVFVTIPIGQENIRKLALNFFPSAEVVSVPNAGYDVGPFFEFLNLIKLDDYDYVVKLHTKRDKPVDWVNFHCFRGGEWRRALLSFCSSDANASRSLKAMSTDPRLGMIACRLLIDPSGIAQGNYPEWKKLSVLQRLGFCPKTHTFVYGTMFMVRASILKPLHGKVSCNDFSIVTNPHADYGLALEWELALPVLAETQGYYVSDGRIWPGLVRPYFFVRKVRLWFLRQFVDGIRSMLGPNVLMRVYRLLRLR